MTLWNDFSQKTTETAAKAVKKTKTIYDVAGLKAAISNEEKKMEVYYSQIGHLYVEKYRDTAEGEFAELIDSIDTANQNIDDYRKQIQVLKGVVVCKKCGAEVSETNSFCNFCGAPIIKVRAQNSEVNMTCTKCGAVLQEGSRFCISCGAPVEIKAESESMETEN